MGKITKRIEEQLVEQLSDGVSVTQACKEAGIGRSTLYKHMARDEALETAVRTAQAQSAEKALEELDEIYSDALSGRKKYDPNILRDYSHHVRWKATKILSDRYGDQKNRAGVEISDGNIRIMWETDSGTGEDTV